MPSATIGAVPATHANPGIHGNTGAKYQPNRDAYDDIHSDTDGDTR
jgi:hypothetical protein